MTEFRSSSLAQQVFEKLENDIILGVYPRGEVLTELKLVDQLGVSRTPIREALRRLEQERLIQDIGKGSLVLGITETDLVDIMAIREYVEAMASYYAATKINEDGKRKLTHIMDLQDFYLSKQDFENLRQMDESFQSTVCQLSGRTVIADTLLPLHRKTRRYRQASIMSEERMRAMCEEHRQISNAIIVSDAMKAAELTKVHIANAHKSMRERMKQHG